MACPDKEVVTRSGACRWTRLGELEAEVGRTEALYHAVTEEGRVAEEEGVSLTELRGRLNREMVQLGNNCPLAALVQRFEVKRMKYIKFNIIFLYTCVAYYIYRTPIFNPLATHPD